MQPPPFDHDFSHSLIRDLSTGPRREATLLLHPLLWVGHQGHYGPAVRVRFGSIVNTDEVEAFFKTRLHKGCELAWVRNDPSQESKPRSLFFHIECERVESGQTIHCGSVTVAEVSPPLFYDPDDDELRQREQVWGRKKW